MPADSPAFELPWIISIGPLAEDEAWDAIVVGPYERDHALAIAAELVADDQLMAVVEPVTPFVSVATIREEIALARATALETAGDEDDDAADSDAGYEALTADDEALTQERDENDEEESDEPPVVPTTEEIRAGVARVAARLLAEHLEEQPIIDD